MEQALEKFIDEVKVIEAAGVANLEFGFISGGFSESHVALYFNLDISRPYSPWIILQVYADGFNKEITLPSPSVECLVTYGETWVPEQGTVKCLWDSAKLLANGEFDLVSSREGIPRMKGSFNVQFTNAHRSVPIAISQTKQA